MVTSRMIAALIWVGLGDANGPASRSSQVPISNKQPKEIGVKRKVHFRPGRDWHTEQLELVLHGLTPPNPVTNRHINDLFGVVGFNQGQDVIGVHNKRVTLG